MSKLLYIDAPTGLAGDMLLAALLDLGADEKRLRQYLSRLDLPGWELKISAVDRASLICRRVEIEWQPQHEHRRLGDILALIDKAAFPAPAAELARRAFILLAEAEAKVHGCAPEQVHFHEVGAVDSILDICGVALASAELGIVDVYCPALPLSQGWVDCAHGRLPVPAPATAELLQGFRLQPTELTGELVTPTGAALLRAWGARPIAPPPFILEAQGRGAGRRELAIPNAVRLLLGREDREPGQEEQDWVEVIRANMDDASGELLAAFLEQAMEAGALDVCFLPLTMKKGRPGWQAQVIAAEGQGDAVARLLLELTSAIGCRISRERRLKSSRRLIMADTPYGPVAVKVSGSTIAPEADSCAEAARAAKVSFKEVYYAALSAAWQEERP